MTPMEAINNTAQLCKAENLIERAIEDLELSGIYSMDLEEALNIIQNLPAFVPDQK